MLRVWCAEVGAGSDYSPANVHIFVVLSDRHFVVIGKLWAGMAIDHDILFHRDAVGVFCGGAKRVRGKQTSSLMSQVRADSLR